MATELMESTTGPEPLPTYEAIDHYAEWQKREGAPIVTGFYIDDLKTMELGRWERKGGRGAFVNLEGTGGVNDAHVVEIAPGGSSSPERHMYEEAVHILSGRGSTSVWYDENKKQTFEWGKGSLFAIPLNAQCQHFNASGLEPARYIAVTNAPTILRMFHNLDFVFNNPFQFEDRFSASQNYFNGEGKLYARRFRHVWQTNFVPDVQTIKLHSWRQRGGGGRNIMLELAENSMGAHVSEFEPGMYKKAHRHGPGAHVIMLDGVGYSQLWEHDFARHTRCDWKPGSVVVPPDNWFHQHFNVGTEPARYLALHSNGIRHRQTYHVQRGEGTDVSIKEGGRQVEYEDEEPSIHSLFEAELSKHGAVCRMKGQAQGCTGLRPDA